MSRVLVVVLLACVVCIPIPRRDTAANGAVVGQVFRHGRPTPAEVTVHRCLALDPEDPYAHFADLKAYTVHLRVAAEATPPVARATTDAEGRFEIRGLAPGLYDLHARTADGATAVSRFALAVPGLRVPVRPEIPVSVRAVDGVATNADGTPFHGWVEMRPSTAWFPRYVPGWGARAVHTDDAGRFRFERAPEGELDFALVVPDRLRCVTERVRPLVSEPVRLTLPAGGTPLEGEVVAYETGSPLPDAPVYAAAGWRDGHIRRLLRTDDAGRFVTHLPFGSGLVVAGGVPGRFLHRVKRGLEDRGPVRLRLARTSSISGVVVDKETGEPVSGALVWAGIEMQRWPYVLPRTARTDRRGRFAIDSLPSWRHVVFVAGGGWVSPELPEGGWWGYDPLGWTTKPGETVEARLVATRTRRVEGRIFGPDGRPVGGARVHMSGSRPGIRVSDPLFDIVLGLRDTATDRQGRYAIEEIRSDVDLHLEVSAPDLPTVALDVERATESLTTSRDVHLPRGAWLDCSYFERNRGDPIPEARVWVKASGLGWGSRSVAAGWRTDARGHVRVGPVLPGAFEIRAEADGWARVIQDVALAEDAREGRDLDVPLPTRRARRASGRVVAPEGVPLDAVSVRTDLTPHLRIPLRELGDGRFELPDLPDHAFEVSAFLRWDGRTWGGDATVTPTATEVVIELKPRAGREPAPEPNVVVRVRGPDGSPVPAGEVTLVAERKEGRDRHEEGKVSDGVARVRCPDDAFRFWISVHDLEGDALGPVRVGPFEPGTSEVAVELVPARRITGRVLWPSGRGIRGVHVSARDTKERSTAFEGAHTDDDGGFDLGPLGREEVWLELRGPKGYLGLEPRWVKPGGELLTIQMLHGTEVTLFVIDEENRPLEGATLELRAMGFAEVPKKRREAMQARGLYAHATADEDGMFVLRGLNPQATYHFRLSPRTGLLPQGPMRTRLTHVPEVREGWVPQDETIRLRSTHTLIGFVMRADDGPLPPSMYLMYRLEEDGPRDFASLREGGVFIIRNLPPGTVRLEARGFDSATGNRFESELLTVATDEEDVTILLRKESRPGSRKWDPPDLPPDREPEPAVRIRVTPWEPGARRVVAHLWAQDAGTGKIRRKHLSSKGCVTFEVPRHPGTTPYELWIHDGKAGWYVHARDLTAADDEIALEKQRGETIHGRVVPPEGAAASDVEIRATSRGGLKATTRPSEDGTFRLTGLPLGDWRLRASVEIGGRTRVATAVVTAGGEGEIVLRPTD